MITQSEIDRIAAFAQANGPEEITVSAMRKSWPDYHFTWCEDDDISAAQPVRSFDGFNLYLAAGAGGCIGFTGDANRATGIVIARIEQDLQD